MAVTAIIASARQPTEIRRTVTTPKMTATKADSMGAAPDTATQREPRLLSAEIWRDAALMWLAQIALIALFALAGALAINPRLTPARVLTNWTAWDAAIYSSIAQGGYRFPWQAAYYPVLPGLERLLMTLPGVNATVAGPLIAAAATLIAFGLLRALVEREYGRAIARRSLLYLIVFPTAFFLLAGYAESLFLLFSVACFIALRRKRWLVAGALAAVATLTRPVGALLVAPILVEYLVERLPTWRAAWRATGWRLPTIPTIRATATELARPLAGAALPAVAIGGYSLALGPVLGGQTLLQAEASNWFKRGFAPPWTGYLRDGGALLTTQSAYIAAHILLDGAFTTLFIVLSLTLWRRLPPAYVAYTWASLALVLMTPSFGWLALGSNMRFMLVVCPLFIGLGKWGARPWANALILGVSLLLLALLTTVFAIGGWVA